jgi:KaiC/GvpD/RAD55 family RecA-like ATPase
MKNEMKVQTKSHAELRRKWAVRTPDELRKRSQELGEDYLIEGIMPERSLGVMVGDSGLGKSPLLYQMAVCVAAGVPFLGNKTHAGRVLCLDFENGLGQVNEMVSRLTQHLELEKEPENLLLWNFNDYSSEYSRHTILDMIREFEPKLVIIDSLTGYHPEIEEKNALAMRCYQEFRKIIQECGCTIIGVHHIRKPSDNPKFKPDPLEIAKLRHWFNQARGARVLINGSDVRLGVDEPHLGSLPQEVALVMRGFERVRGEIPFFYLARVLDEDGEPLGYRRVKGSSLLPTEQREAFTKLHDTFRFKEAKQVYGKGDQATIDFLRKCISLGLLNHVHRGPYVKVSTEEENSSPDSGQSGIRLLPPEEAE